MAEQGEVAAVAEVAGGHHVLRVEDLLGQLGDGEGTEAVCATAGEGCEADHEEVETWEGNHVDGQLRRSLLSCPGKRKQVVTPDMTAETR